MKISKIGVIVADAEEYKPFASIAESMKHESYSFLGRTGHKFTLESGNRQAEIYSLLCGIGKVNAAAAAAHMADIGCGIILNFGLSGGISGAAKGDIVLGTEFVEHDFDLTGIGYKPCEKPGQKYIYYSDPGLNELFRKMAPWVKSGTAVTGDRFICDDSARKFFKDNFRAVSCDMETAAIAYVCGAAGIPYLSLRQISDDAGNDAADSYRTQNNLCDTVLSELMIEFIKLILDSGLSDKL